MNKLQRAEKKLLSQIEPQLRGYHLALIGNQRNLDWLPKNRLHNFMLSDALPASVLSHYETLPLRNNSLDAVFLPYTLEHCQHPMELLKELHRCLLSKGKLFIFASHSWHPLHWFNHAVSLPHIKHWLAEADFVYKKSHFLYYGSVICVEAQKETLATTPLIKPQWENKLALDKHWQPTTRGASYETFPEEQSHD